MMLEQLTYWHWFIFALLLLILELFVPGAFFLSMGVAAGVVGVVLWLFPVLGWEYQFLIFGVLSVVTVMLWRRHMSDRPQISDQPHLNRRGEQYVGRSFTLQEPIVNGQGKIRVDDSTWKIHGTDRPAGSQITVTGVDGVVLLVQ
jgi:hypothetical protein